MMYIYGDLWSHKILEYNITNRTSNINYMEVDIADALKLKIRYTEFSELLFDFSDSELDDEVVEFLNTICITDQGNSKFINQIRFLNTIFN